MRDMVASPGSTMSMTAPGIGPAKRPAPPRRVIPRGAPHAARQAHTPSSYHRRGAALRPLGQEAHHPPTRPNLILARLTAPLAREAKQFHAARPLADCVDDGE